MRISTSWLSLSQEKYSYLLLLCLSVDLDSECMNMVTPQSEMYKKAKNISKKKIISAF